MLMKLLKWKSLITFNKYGDFVAKNAKFEKFWNKNGQILAIFHKNLIFSKSRQYGFFPQKGS